MTGLNPVGRRRCLPPFRGGTFLEGDITLYTEPENFSETAIPPRLLGRAAFVDPLIARLHAPIPPEVRDLPRDLPIVYFAMGSSGIEDTVRAIPRNFTDQLNKVIARKNAAIQRYYKSALRDNPKTEGNVQVTFTVNTAGAIQKVDITGATGKFALYIRDKFMSIQSLPILSEPLTLSQHYKFARE